MTGLVRKALTLAAGLTVVASVASAGVPDPRTSSVETVIIANGSGNMYAASVTSSHPGVGFEVTVRDVNNTALVGRTVVLDFSATSIKLNGPNGAVYNGTTVNCVAKTLSKATNGSGQAIFGAKAALFVNANSVEVSADGVVLANVQARSTDIDGASSVSGNTNSADLNLFRQQLFAAQPAAAQTNFDISADGFTNSADLNIFRNELFSGAVAPYCP